MTLPTVVIADDHAIFLDGLQRILEPNCNLVGVAHNGQELVDLAALLKPDIAVVDISMPILNGIDALRRMRRANLPTKVIFLTASGDVWLGTQALKLGAKGYVLKQSASDELIQAIRMAMNGEVYIAPSIASQVLQHLLHQHRTEEGPTLTVREREVLQLLAEGKTLKETAGILCVSPRTVEFHRNNLADKTGLRTTAELTRYAIRNGVIAAESGPLQTPG